MPRKRKVILKIIEEASAAQTPVLDLSNCDLRDLIEQICRMNWLTGLNLAHCHLDVLPDEFGNLINLTRLDLSENQIKMLPESFVNLTALQSLTLTHAGYGFMLSVPLEQFVDQIPEVVWEDKPPSVSETAYIAFPENGHPNLWLEWLKNALKLYGAAFNMEERGGGGYDVRTRADKEIGKIFGHLDELKEIFPEFYDDFEKRRFYDSNRESEKTIEGNPFRLPTAEDDEWIIKFSRSRENLPPLHLIDEIVHGRQIWAINTETCRKSKVFLSGYGGVTVSNMFYAEAEYYFSDCEATLLQAGDKRFYVRVEEDGWGGTNNKWFVSENGGTVWHSQPNLTFQWLENNHRRWRELSYLARRKQN